MQSVLTFVLFSLSICCALGQDDGDVCLTTNEEYVEGTCMPLFKCPELMSLVRTDREYLKQFHCGWEELIPMVCCPPPVTTTTSPVLRNACVTHEGNKGACVEIRSCPKIEKMYYSAVTNYKKTEKAKKEYSILIKSRCVRAMEPQAISFCCDLEDVFEQ